MTMTKAEKNTDKFARAFAERYGIAWSSLRPEDRDAWREQVSSLLAYIDSTAFVGMLPKHTVQPNRSE